MQVTLEIQDPELAICGLNNAIVAYSQIVGSVELGCDIPGVFEKLLEKKCGDDHDARFELLSARHSALKDIYNQLVAQLEPESL